MIDIIYNSLLIWAVWFITPDIDEDAPDPPGRFKIILKPFFLCPPCMASVWGTIYYITINPMPSIHGWFAHCVLVCGLNVIISHLMPKE